MAEIEKEAERNEEEIVAQANIKVRFGGDEYEFPPLVIRESREWRKKVITLLAPLPGNVAKLKMDNAEEFDKSLRQMLVTDPDEVIKLFYEYAKDLDQEEIEGKGTDAEMAAAFQEVVKVAFPLAESLPKVMARLAQ